MLAGRQAGVPTETAGAWQLRAVRHRRARAEAQAGGGVNVRPVASALPSECMTVMHADVCAQGQSGCRGGGGAAPCDHCRATLAFPE